MTRESVDSTNLSSIGYDPDKRILEVEFHANRLGYASVWQYADVAPDTFEHLMASPSVGAAFRRIRMEHEGTWVAVIENGIETSVDAA